MLFVGLLEMERQRDNEFWAVLWQGASPPDDFKLVGAYNLMTNLRVIVFEAETTQTIRFLDRFNLVGRWSCHVSLDQTVAYQAAFERDAAGLGAFLKAQGLPDAVAAKVEKDRRQMMTARSLGSAIRQAAEIDPY